MSKSVFLIVLSLFLGLFAHQTVQAHFPWLVRQSDGKLFYFFGEGLTDRNYKLPPSLADARIVQLFRGESPREIVMAAVENEEFVGLQSESSVTTNSIVASHATFGIYQGARLDYYSYHFAGSLAKSREGLHGLKSGMDLGVEIIDTENGVDCYVTWSGHPLNEVEVHLYCSEGHEEAKRKTDKEGRVSFTDQEVEDGINGIMLGHKITESGQWKEKNYETQSHYLTATFYDPESSHQEEVKDHQALLLPKLPVELTSFGAVRAGDSVFLFGGHTGEAHSYSMEAQNDKLFKLDLKHVENGWKELATGPKLQGLGMVAHENKVILLGGFTATNQEGQEHDLRSQATVHAFDIHTQQWTKLADLPEPRSSHDAALIGNTIYVVGGWNIQGKGNATWHSTAWSMDLDAENPEWKELPKAPFVRRALAAVAHDGKLFAIGGMNEKGGPTCDVVIYDPSERSWSEGGTLQGEKPMAGFGASGWSLDGHLVVTTFEGSIQKWDSTSKSWQILGKTKDARFFHRMFPLDRKSLVSVGGASMIEGKFAELEIVPIHPAFPK